METTSPRTMPRASSRPPVSVGGASGTGVLDDEEPTLDVAHEDDARPREDVGAPGAVESAGAAGERVVEPEAGGLLGVRDVEKLDALGVVRHEQPVAVH